MCARTLACVFVPVLDRKGIECGKERRLIKGSKQEEQREASEIQKEKRRGEA